MLIGRIVRREVFQKAASQAYQTKKQAFDPGMHPTRMDLNVQKSYVPKDAALFM
jgi:hypothetical protein